MIASNVNRYNTTPLYVGTIIGIVVFILIVRWGLKRDPRPINHRLPSSFLVYPNGIEINGTKMNKNDIHRIIIRNAHDNSVRVLGPPSMSQSAGVAMSEMIQQISYELNIEAGGRAHQLAGGLDEVTANGLLTDVSYILDFK